MRTKTIKKNKINVVTLGCSKNIYDSEILMGQLKANGKEVVRAEAMTVLNALQHSRLLSGIDDSDLIFLVTARYTFVQDFESTVRRSCGLLPMLVLQNPPWVPMWARQETSILQFSHLEQVWQTQTPPQTPHPPYPTLRYC